MSVIFFDKTELVPAIASAWSQGSIGSPDAKERLAELAVLASSISEANAMAYAETYMEITEPLEITAHDIEREIVRPTLRKDQAFRKLRMIRYNLIANNGRDFATREILDGLVDLLDSALTIMDRRAAA